MWKVTLVIILFSIFGGMFSYQYFNARNEGVQQVLQVGKDIIYVSEQRPGASVLVNRVSMTKDGYVVIYDNDNGRFGRIIGNSKILLKGESVNVPIGLIRPTVNGEFLFAMLHEDNGDNAFYPTIDVPLRDQDGNIMYMFFGINENTSQPRDFSL